MLSAGIFSWKRRTTPSNLVEVCQGEPPVLATVTLVLELAGKPMRAREIHEAACTIAGRPLLWNSVEAALAASSTGERARFRRLRRGIYGVTTRFSRSQVECQKKVKILCISRQPTILVSQAFPIGHGGTET